MAEPEPEALARVGSTIDGRYKLVEIMASGSMGAVYQAERIPVGKLVAIKFLHTSYANDAEFQARFERETRVASKLAHPNCVAVLDFGVWEGAPYLVMEYVAGQTLRARLDKGPMPAQQALAFTRQIAAGLAHAHEQGIFHRDIKPANIMITNEIGSGERVRILDFGLARLRGNVGRDATQHNMVVGTPNYMAPEQTVGGGTIDARTDIYAVGVVLFEMVVGERPFHAEDTLQLLGMHRGAPIPRLLDRAKPGTEIPNGLQELIDKMMAKSPDKRYQNAIELAEAIDDLIAMKRAPTDTDPVIIEPSGRKKRANTAAVAPTVLDVESSKVEYPGGRSRFWRTMISSMILVGGGAAAAGYLLHRHAEQEVRSGSNAGRDAAAISSADADVHSAFVTPDAITAQQWAIDAGPQATDAPQVAAVPADAAGPDALLDDAGLPIIGPPDKEEVEIDPAKAVDLDPQAAKGSAAPQPEDEAADAPKTREEVEKKTPQPSPQQTATTLHDAVELIQQGKRDLALASLRQLRTKNPHSAYIPFLLGNLYYDQKWWSVAMDDYADAIKKNSEYRRNPTLNRNVIRMLGSPKTQWKASAFLRNGIGRSALPFLKWAAKYEENGNVRRAASTVARQIR
jgi:serine/threonine-protein kinase